MDLPAGPETECPVCLGTMLLEEHEAVTWLVCPNGCPTEMPAPARASAPAEEIKHATAAA